MGILPKVVRGEQRPGGIVALVLEEVEGLARGEGAHQGRGIEGEEAIAGWRTCAHLGRDFGRQAVSFNNEWLIERHGWISPAEQYRQLTAQEAAA